MQQRNKMLKITCCWSHNLTRLLALSIIIYTAWYGTLKSSDLDQQDIFKSSTQGLHSVKNDDKLIHNLELPTFANNGLSINDLLDHIPTPPALTFDTVIIKITKIMGYDKTKLVKLSTKINIAELEEGSIHNLSLHHENDVSNLLCWTGLTRFKMHQYDRAMRCFSQALQLRSINIHRALHIQYFLSHCLIEQGHHQEALSHLYTIQHDENISSKLNHCVTHQIGLCHLKMSNFRQAIKNFDLLINTNHLCDKLKSLALLHCGIAKAHEKNYCGALMNFKLIADIPAADKILRGYWMYNQSLVKYKLGLWKEALRDLNKLKKRTQLDTTIRAKIVILFSCINMNLGHPQLALDMLDQIFDMAKLPPDIKISALFYRGIVNHLLKIHQSSLMDYDRVLAAPNIDNQLKANTLYFRGLVLFDCRKYKKSAADFFELLLLNDLNDHYKSTLFQRLGLIDMVYRSDHAALQKFNVALSTNNKKNALDVSCHYCTALIYKHLLSIDRACRSLIYLLTVKNLIANNQLSEIYKMLGMNQDVIEA